VHRKWPNPRILDAAGVISPSQAVLGNPFPLDKRILDDVKPGINIRQHPALLGRQHIQQEAIQFCCPTKFKR
jgi:hypothetical protein